VEGRKDKEDIRLDDRGAVVLTATISADDTPNLNATWSLTFEAKMSLLHRAVLHGLDRGASLRLRAFLSIQSTQAQTPRQQLLTLRELDRLVTSIAREPDAVLSDLPSTLTMLLLRIYLLTLLGRIIRYPHITTLPAGDANPAHTLATFPITRKRPLQLYNKCTEYSRAWDRGSPSPEAHERELHLVRPPAQERWNAV